MGVSFPGESAQYRHARDRLLARPPGQEPVHRDLVTPDHLDECVGAAPHGLLDQHTVGLHVAPKRCLPSTCYCRLPGPAFAPADARRPIRNGEAPVTGPQLT